MVLSLIYGGVGSIIKLSAGLQDGQKCSIRRSRCPSGFLSAVLKLKPDEIKETHLLNTNFRKLHEEEKQGILNVRILMNDNTEIDIEIQLAELKVWVDRSLFYLSKMYTKQIQKGQQYDVFKKCVSISILDFIFFPKESEFYSCFRLMEETRHIIYTDKMEFHVFKTS